MRVDAHARLNCARSSIPTNGGFVLVQSISISSRWRRGCRAVRRQWRRRHSGRCMLKCSNCRPCRVNDPPVLAHLAVFADPWPGPVAIWRSLDDGASYQQFAIVSARAIVGETLDDLPAGPTSRWDKVARGRVKLYGGALASASDLRVLTGANAAAVQRTDGAWEILQFANAVLTADRTYELSRLLRGELGTEA